MNKRHFILILMFSGLAGLAQYAHEIRPRTIVLWLMQPIGEAHAYKVQKVCEEVQTKRGPREQCRSVLRKEEVGTSNQPKKDGKTEAGKSNAGHGTSH
jgi:hypothetical protein